MVAKIHNFFAFEGIEETFPLSVGFSIRGSLDSSLDQERSIQKPNLDCIFPAKPSMKAIAAIFFELEVLKLNDSGISSSLVGISTTTISFGFLLRVFSTQGFSFQDFIERSFFRMVQNQITRVLQI